MVKVGVWLFTLFGNGPNSFSGPIVKGKEKITVKVRWFPKNHYFYQKINNWY